MEEIWKVIPDFKDYQISNLGNLRSFRTGKEIYIKPYLNEYGYYKINIYGLASRRTVFLHRLIAEAFIPNPENKQMVNHIDGVKTNNSLSNLEWVTRQENMSHAVRMGLTASGSRNFFSKLTSEDVCVIIDRYTSGGISMRALAKEYNVEHGSINRIINGDGWQKEKVGLLKSKLDAYHGII